ncbi:type IV secretion system protein [Paraburkholderia heleia]|uniref:type IV secretion system protein n=1 Tax=Paraburkholderia heleia TaxID=634127 RepID=UPI002AB78DB3|nr:type IV secretion system protein [Paraburkholderia heleia]
METVLSVSTALWVLTRRGLLIVVLLCVALTTHAQGVPTISPAELAQQMTMVQKLVQQIQNQEDQIRAMTGNSGLGMIANNPALRSYLPEEWQDIYAQAKAGSLSGVSSSMLAIEQQEGMAGATTPGQQRFYDTLAANKAMNEQAYSAITARFSNIESLMQQSNLTQDPTEKADLQNRLAAEEAMVANDQTRLQLTANLQREELRLAEEQRDREFKSIFLGGTNGQ